MVPALIALALAVGTLWSTHRADPDRPHGNPDPGGRRMAFLHTSAASAVHDGAEVLKMTSTPYRWDHGGCDGGAPGWARAEVDLTFRGGTFAQIDDALARLHWVVDTDSADPNPVRQYETAGAARDDDGYIWLYRRGATWEIDVTAGPAEVPTHAC